MADKPKIRRFEDKPKLGDGGQYIFYNHGDNAYPASDSIPEKSDKFAKDVLGSVVLGHRYNDLIIKNQLVSPDSVSRIVIDKFVVSTTVSYEIKNSKMRIYMYDLRTLETIAEDNPLPEDITSIYEQYGIPVPYNVKWDHWRSFMSGYKIYDSSLAGVPSGFAEGEPKNYEACNDVLIAKNLDGGVEATIDGIEVPEYSGKPTGMNFGNNTNDMSSGMFHPEFPGQDNDSNPTALFDNTTTGKSEILIVIKMEGDVDRWYGTDNRETKLHFYKIDQKGLFNSDGSGKDNTFVQMQPYSTYKWGGGYDTKAPVWKINDFTLSIYTAGRAWVPGELPDEEPVTSARYMNINTDWDTQFLTQNITQEIATFHPFDFNSNYPSIPWFGVDEDGDREDSYISSTDRRNILKDDFTPVPIVELKDGANVYHHLSAYQPDVERQERCSAPNRIKIDYYTCHDTGSGDYNLNQDNQYYQQTGDLKFKFCVVRWNDIDDELISAENFLDDIPLSLKELEFRKEQDEYNWTDMGTPLVHIYNTAGVKYIKSIFVSYLNDSDGYSQIIRWKFIKTKIFLDIPVNQFPDFGELGGSEYTTLPWPNTVPIIGGRDINSKYDISLEKTLQGGKIGITDYIDKRFLLNTYTNDEMGQSIKVFDLEQVRFFTTGSYDMSTLLGINQLQLQTNLSEEYLSTLPYPQYFEEYDIKNDNTLSEWDVSLWNSYGRPDIANDILNRIDTNNIPPSITDYVFQGIVGIHDNGMAIMGAGPFQEYDVFPTSDMDDYINYFSLELFINTLACSEVFGGDGHWTDGDYEVLQSSGSAIDTEGREWKTFDCNYADPNLEANDISTYYNLSYWHPYSDNEWWDGLYNSFPQETSVGEIFINDNSDQELKKQCKFELNVGNKYKSFVDDTSGNSNKGILIGDYKIKKRKKGSPTKRESFIKLPNKNNNENGAL